MLCHPCQCFVSPIICTQQNSHCISHLPTRQSDILVAGQVVDKKIMVGMCQPRFSKIGSAKLIFWLESGVSGINFCYRSLQGVSQKLKFNQKWQKMVLKCNFFFQEIEVWSLELGKGWKKWISRATCKKWPEKGVLRAAHAHTNVSTPPILYEYQFTMKSLRVKRVPDIELWNLGYVLKEILQG